MKQTNSQPYTLDPKAKTHMCLIQLDSQHLSLDSQGWFHVRPGYAGTRRTYVSIRHGYAGTRRTYVSIPQARVSPQACRDTGSNSPKTRECKQRRHGNVASTGTSFGLARHEYGLAINVLEPWLHTLCVQTWNCSFSDAQARFSNWHSRGTDTNPLDAKKRGGRGIGKNTLFERHGCKLSRGTAM